MFLVADNHMPKLSSMVSSSEYLLPLNAEMPSSTSVIMHEYNPAVSFVLFGMGVGRSSFLRRSQVGTRSNVNVDQQLQAYQVLRYVYLLAIKLNVCKTDNQNLEIYNPVDSSPTIVPSISVSINQSSIIGHILTSLTTKPSSPVTATSIAPSAGKYVMADRSFIIHPEYYAIFYLHFTTDVDSPADFTASIPSSLTSNIPNGISGSITAGISTGIPGGMTTDIPASIPTLNLGAKFTSRGTITTNSRGKKSMVPHRYLTSIRQASFRSSVSAVIYI
ncbi:hypothetical protein DBV15_11126 [Temnothorax longispinosus]|uniref:Uncharacterized protein n=1 Tax=Temnothorax longispinosus TaxID=300112 RepID=A0A4S2KGY3_9HYME|nr:hypothetical protein DBV15_11126 [Temnothorax longispinosus]